MDIPSKFGSKKFDKIVINDGYTSITIFGKILQIFKKGRVMVLPISIASNEKVYIDVHTLEKLEAVVLEYE